MNMRPEEKIVQEKRTILAASKNLMGSEGKLGTIAKYLGEKIIRQGSPLFDATYLNDPYDIVDEDEIPTAGESDRGYEEGWIFSGLGYGIHLEIQLYELENRLVVYYKGYEVYREEAGDLLTYAPFTDWEKRIESLYKKAREKEVKFKGDIAILLEREIQKEKKSFFQKLRLKWGV
jgi:hypothetical protein